MKRLLTAKQVQDYLSLGRPTWESVIRPKLNPICLNHKTYLYDIRQVDAVVDRIVENGNLTTTTVGLGERK